MSILSLGEFLPDLRSNDWWPVEMVEKWAAQPAPLGGNLPRDVVRTDAVQATLEAMAALKDDPFNGIVSRPVMPPEMLTSDMEALAASDALERAGIAPHEIGLLIQQSTNNNYISPQNACLLHEKLGLRRECFTVGTECHSDSFTIQLTLAEAMINAGQVDYALLIQSSGHSRLAPSSAPYASWLGDGATAQVVGPTEHGSGTLGRAHFTDGTFFDTYGVTVPDAAWYVGGSPQFRIIDPHLLRQMMLQLADRSRETLIDALGAANLDASDVDYLATHQPTVWLGELLRSTGGLDTARMVNTCSTLGNVGACNAPLGLRRGCEQGLLSRGDRVVIQTGGGGMTYSALVMEWSLSAGSFGV